MYRIPAAILSLTLSILCTSRIIAFPVLIWIAAIYMALIAGWYIISVKLQNTSIFHKYIGWTWGIIPVCFTLFSLFNRYTDWNRLWLFAIGLTIGLLFSKIWEKDPCSKLFESVFLGKVSSIIIAGMFVFLVMGLNESTILESDFDSIEIIEMDSFVHTQTFTEEISYFLYFDYSNGDIEISEYTVSENYFNSLQVGDRVPICICTGLFGKKYYIFYEEPDSEFDFYGLNEWAKVQATLQNQ